MGQDPEAIRQQIEDTREEMSGTVEALGQKADVKGRAKGAIQERKDALVSKVSGSTPDGRELKDGARRAAGVAQENPLGLAVGGLAAGFLLGMLVPSTRVEDERLGELSDQVKEKAKETGQEALERGKEVAQEAAQSAGETVKESGQQQAQEMAASVQGGGSASGDSTPAGPPAVAATGAPAAQDRPV